jgi:hypothetical protein
MAEAGATAAVALFEVWAVMVNVAVTSNSVRYRFFIVEKLIVMSSKIHI